VQVYGAVVDIIVHPRSVNQDVYVKFKAPASAQNTQQALHGRTFGGIRIEASVLTEKDQGYQHAVASKTPAAATTAAV
jgi:hypothetical protein